jgi:hypothetical protein
MRTITLIATLFLSVVSMAQSNDVSLTKNCVAKEYFTRELPVPQLANKRLTYGDFEVSHYRIISAKPIISKDLDQLIGTTIRIKKTDITGDAIDPFTIYNEGILDMTRDEFVHVAFGPEYSSKGTNLPEEIRIHKNGRVDCYGIVILSKTEVALPYKGSLLFLKLK